MHTLYLKTHNVTGLKYLGKTIGNPYTYPGSGALWRKHLKEHGTDVTTEILCQSDDIDVVRKAAAQYQSKVDVKSSKDFANLMVEGVPDGFRRQHRNEWDRCICPRCNVEIRSVDHYKMCHSSVG